MPMHAERGQIVDEVGARRGRLAERQRQMKNATTHANASQVNTLARRRTHTLRVARSAD